MSNFDELTTFRSFFDKLKYARYTYKYKARVYREEYDRASPVNIALWRIATSTDPSSFEIVTSHSDMSQEKDGIFRHAYHTMPRGCIRMNGLSFIFEGYSTSRMDKIYIKSRKEFIENPPAAVCAYMDEIWKGAKKIEREKSKKDEERETLHGIMESVLDESGL